MASFSMLSVRNLYKLNSRLTTASSATTFAPRFFSGASGVTVPFRCFSTNNSYGSVFTEFTPQSPEGMHSKNNPFQCNGPTGGFQKFVSVHEEMFLRIDMPGVEQEGVKIWKEAEHPDTVFYSGEAPKEWEYEESGRSYAGKFHLKCGCCHVKGVKASCENGVVTVLVSKEKIK